MAALPAGRRLSALEHLPLGAIAALTALFILTGIVGYVYSHDPVRDTLAVDLTTAVDPRPAHISGTVSSVDGQTVTIRDAAGAEHTLTLAPGARTEALRRLAEAPASGAVVNIGMDETSFGRFITGIVEIKAAP